MEPVFMAACVHMQGVRPIADNQPGQLQPLLLDTPVARSIHVVVRGKLHDHRKVPAALFLADLNQLLQESGPVFQASAVFIRPRIPAPGQKLVGQIAAVGMNLHAVRPAAQGRLDRLTVVRLQQGNLFPTQLVAFHSGCVHPAAGAGADGNFVPGAGPANPPVSGHNLGAYHAAIAVAALYNPGKQLLCVLREENGVVHRFKAVRALHVAEDQGSTALGPLHEVIHGGSVHIPHRHAHRSHDHSVFQFHPSDPDRFCQYRCHIKSPPLSKSVL